MRKGQYMSGNFEIATGQDSPTVRPSASMSILWDAGCLGRPGMVLMSPARG